MRVLGGPDALYESLHASQPMRAGRQHGVHYRCNDSLLFGAVALEETAFPAGAITPLQAASTAAYEQIFAAMKAQAFPHALRFWNYMADINHVTHGLERYRQFNLGRQQAFDAETQFMANVPAACALGTAGGPLTIAFLAGRTPSLAIENPRQVSAYDYPPQYGPRSPLFSRAGVVSIGGTRLLFLSGTASIVGHATLHAGDVLAQTEESLTNIAAVLAEVGSRTATPCALADLDYIVYIRKAEDFAKVQQALTQRIGAALKAVYVQADICRSDLLVEIEGSAELLPR
jgi:enamine deaminase RidA (YjgF/YER057c/UK114 family)